MRLRCGHGRPARPGRRGRGLCGGRRAARPSGGVRGLRPRVRHAVRGGRAGYRLCRLRGDEPRLERGAAGRADLLY